MDVDALEAGEVAFTLVTNKKGSKGKAKASSPPPTNSRNKILLVSRAPPTPKAVTASGICAWRELNPQPFEHSLKCSHQVFSD